MIHGYGIKAIKKIPMLEDIPDHSDHDAWHYYHLTTFHLIIPKIYDTWILLQLKPSRTSLNFEDIPDHPDIPDGHLDVWNHYHSITFRLRIPKIYITWVFVAIKAIKNIPILGGHS